jgi:hypothetical protein
MERGRPARKKNHEAGETPALQCSFKLKTSDDCVENSETIKKQ